MEIFDKLLTNPSNPRNISKGNFSKLKESIKNFPKMLALRPIIYDKDFTILAGRMRYSALQELVREGFELKEEYFRCADDLTEEEKRQFIIKDNISSGSWDFDILANEWSDLPLADWGIDNLKDMNGGNSEEGEVEFSEELMESHNYVVLYFDNDMDWLNLQTMFPLKSVKALDSKPGFEKVGVGRVIKGSEFLKIIKGEN